MRGGEVRLAVRRHPPRQACPIMQLRDLNRRELAIVDAEFIDRPTLKPSITHPLSNR